MNGPAFEKRAPECRAPLGLDWHIFDVIHELLREAVGLGAVENPISLACNVDLIGIAEPGRRFNESLQNCLEIKGRAADDFEHVGGGGLLLQRLGQIARARLYLVK
jgi:hypothetical protein